MKIINLNYYKVELYDEGETRRFVGYFSNLADANKAVVRCNKKGWYGQPWKVDEKIKIYESFEEYTDADKKATKASALSKLDPDELEALGLK